MISVSVFGMTGNILIICAYAKIGFTESINISYCALGISDALSIPFITWHAICFLPVLNNWNLPRYLEILTGGAPAEAYYMTTAWLTACISLERCLCVVFPFKVKTLITPKRTLFAVITIFCVITVPIFCFYAILYKVYWTYDHETNRTKLVVRYSGTPLADAIYDVNYFYKGLFLNLFSLILVLVCTVFLAIHLKINAQWRRGNSGLASKDKTPHKKMYGKDMRVVKTVLLIATAFMFLGTLSAIRHLVAFVRPDFRPVGGYRNLYLTISRLSFLLLQINSSMNFLIYYKTGTSFRKAVKEMLCGNNERQP